MSPTIRPRHSWTPDAHQHCEHCTATFGVFTRRHHCRCCGRLVCSACSPSKRKVPDGSGGTAAHRVCFVCEREIDAHLGHAAETARAQAARRRAQQSASQRSASSVGSSRRAQHHDHDDHDHDHTSGHATADGAGGVDRGDGGAGGEEVWALGLDECRAYFENDQICLAKASLELVREGVRCCEDEEARLRGEDLLHTHGGVAEEVDVQNDEVRSLMEDCLEPAVPSGSGGEDEGTKEGGGWRPVKTTNGVQVDFKKAPPGSSGMGSVRLTAEMKAPACQLKMSGKVACILCVTTCTLTLHRVLLPFPYTSPSHDAVSCTYRKCVAPRSAHSLTRYAPSLTQLAAILYEQDMFKQWIPFCNTANELARPSRFQKLMHITMKFPMLLPISNRDVR